jgi:hypothetical protein
LPARAKKEGRAAEKTAKAEEAAARKLELRELAKREEELLTKSTGAKKVRFQMIGGFLFRCADLFWKVTQADIAAAKV